MTFSSKGLVFLEKSALFVMPAETAFARRPGAQVTKRATDGWRRYQPTTAPDQ